MDRIYFPSFDGEQISLLLARPAGGEARPCVVFLHGGAWRFGLADSYARHAEYAVSRGAVDLTGRLNWEMFGRCDMETVTPDTWLEKYRAGAAVSPLLQAGPGNTPVTHMQGLNDEIIFPYETAQLHDRLLACGVESRLILLPGQKHSFILFHYQSPDETVQKYLDMAGDILAEKGFLQ